jgi:hypothetical protein
MRARHDVHGSPHPGGDLMGPKPVKAELVGGGMAGDAGGDRADPERLGEPMLQARRIEHG